MEKTRKIKILSIIALVLSICAMSLGFAAFSTTLNISSSANVTPNSNDFKILLYPSAISTYGTEQHSGGSDSDDVYIYSETSNGAKAENVVLNSSTTSLSGLKANFTEPGQSVTYIVYAGNTGAYDAYLTAINFANISGTSSNKVCTPGDNATASLVSAACNAISISVDVDGTTVTDSETIYNHILYMGSFESISITIDYAPNGARADGPFSVSFGDIAFDYSTVDNYISLITFTINGTEYNAVEGMTFGEWVNSEYNTGGVTVNSLNMVCTKESLYVGSATAIITDGAAYSSSSPARAVGGC